MEIFAQRLLALRKEQGLSQQDAAERSGVQYRSYRRYEQGEREPQASVIVALAKFYGVTTDYLLGLSDER